jgi:GTPase
VVGDHDTLVVADLPGLIEGAAEGRGLGHQFLKHVERCKVLLQLVDVSGTGGDDPVSAWRVVDNELEKSNPDLYRKPRLVIATKCEDEESAARADALEVALRGVHAGGCDTSKVLRISAARSEGLNELLGAARRLARSPS